MNLFGRLAAALVVAGALSAEAHAADGTPQLTAEYLKAAADYVSFADACVALGMAEVPSTEIERIRHQMTAAGAEEAEIEEWKSTAIATRSPRVQEIMRQETENAARYACAEGLKDRHAAITRAESLD